jgi:hypothetical protein
MSTLFVMLPSQRKVDIKELAKARRCMHLHDVKSRPRKYMKPSTQEKVRVSGGSGQKRTEGMLFTMDVCIRAIARCGGVA